jgi:hypothetical protein
MEPTPTKRAFQIRGEADENEHDNALISILSSASPGLFIHLSLVSYRNPPLLTSSIFSSTPSKLKESGFCRGGNSLND